MSDSEEKQPEAKPPQSLLIILVTESLFPQLYPVKAEEEFSAKIKELIDYCANSGQWCELFVVSGEQIPFADNGDYSFATIQVYDKTFRFHKPDGMDAISGALKILYDEGDTI